MKQVIILRKDLNMRKGKMVAQGAHASLQAVLNGMSLDKKHLKIYKECILEWINSGMTKITVGVDSEDELISCYNQAVEKGLICSLITDAGRTEFGGIPTLTAVAIGPEQNKDIDKITKDLKLL